MLNRVLVVDDDRILLRRIQKKSEAYRDRFLLLVAENGRQAVDILKNESVDLVVTDLQMPEMDGFALLAFMSENYPDIPVFIQTAYGTVESRRSVLQGGGGGIYRETDRSRRTCPKNLRRP